MAYQSLYRRYRPQRFSEIRGQEHLVAGLQNAVRTDRVGHAYLFSGPRGTGKTSTARILAKVLNCENPVDAEPCGVCESCVAIENGTSFDVHELDAASNNGVEAIRDLIARTAMGTPGRTKVYILDEVHMLSAAASNALLKTLEETPEHVVFVLATTDPQKVLPTIRSRTQHYELHLLSADELTDLARFIVDDADLEVPAEAIDYVVRMGAGSARDMESALDQVVVAGGLPDDNDALDELIEALCERDTGRALVAVEQAMDGGRSPRLLGEQLISRLRDVFLASMQMDLARLPDRDRDRVRDQATRMGAAGATRALEALGEAFVGIQDAPDPRIPLEVALVRLTRPEADTSIAAVVDRVTRLEHRLADLPAGASPPPPASPPAPPSASSPPPAPEAPAAEAPPPAAAAPTSGGPAREARQVLAAKKGARAQGGRAKPPAPAPAPEAPGRPDPEPARRPAAPPPTDTSGLPTRDELTLAWGDIVLGSLPGSAKARFSAGRFLDVADGTAVFALPNAPHVERSEAVRGEVEAALAAHFGRPVPLRLVVDPGGPGRSAEVESGPPPASADGPDDDIDLSDLSDADDAPMTSVDRVRELFPGAELVEEA
jgi:DNA polymerase-3 subunit gamma/tau